MQRFLSHQHLSQKLSIYEGPRFHQISRVFRGKKGDTFIFFEPLGDDRVYEIVNISKKQIDFVEIEKRTRMRQKKKNITIFQALPNKIGTIEIIVQKLVEIGIENAVFFHSDRSQIQEVPTGKKERISAIAEEALEQSGGNAPMHIIYSENSLEEMFKNIDQDTKHIVGHPSMQNTYRIDDTSGKYALWIGPEGGWSEKEETFFKDYEASFWTFNNNVLRLETASIVGAGILSYLLE